MQVERSISPVSIAEQSNFAIDEEI